MIGTIAEEYLLGIGKKGEDLIILIDIEKILSIEEKIELDEMLEEYYAERGWINGVVPESKLIELEII